MKGEYTLESKNDTSSAATATGTTAAANMFAKLHQRHQQQQHHHHNQNYVQQQMLPHYFQVSPQCRQQTSEEDDTSRSSGGAATTTTATTTITTAIAVSDQQPQQQHGDGASIEAVRRPRGRPPGSKNKPKPAVIITREPEPAMSPYILEIPGGADVIDTITRFSRRRNIGLCILSGTGSVANVTLRQPSNTPAVIFHGRYDILSLSATFLNPSTSSQVPSPSNHISISLLGPQGQIFGGAVVGPLLAAGTVFIIAASFNHPSYHRLPIEEEFHNSGSAGNDNSSPPASGNGGVDSGHTPAGDSIYNCHLTSDVLWAPTARQPQPPPY